MDVISQITEDGRVLFHCPGCHFAHGPWVLDGGVRPKWAWNGSYDKPTFTPSLLVRWPRWNGVSYDNKICHSYVIEGRIQFLDDCTHALVGQTVDLPQWNY